MLKIQLQLGFGVSFPLRRSSPAAEVKGFYHCQAKGPELVIGETKTDLIFLHDPRKIPASTRGVSRGNRGACNKYLEDRFTRERLSHAMQDSKDIRDDGDMQGSKSARWLE